MSAIDLVGNIQLSYNRACPDGVSCLNTWQIYLIPIVFLPVCVCTAREKSGSDTFLTHG